MTTLLPSRRDQNNCVVTDTFLSASDVSVLLFADYHHCRTSFDFCVCCPSDVNSFSCIPHHLLSLSSTCIFSLSSSIYSFSLASNVLKSFASLKSIVTTAKTTKCSIQNKWVVKEKKKTMKTKNLVTLRTLALKKINRREIVIQGNQLRIGVNKGIEEMWKPLLGFY